MGVVASGDDEDAITVLVVIGYGDHDSNSGRVTPVVVALVVNDSSVVDNCDGVLAASVTGVSVDVSVTVKVVGTEVVDVSAVVLSVIVVALEVVDGTGVVDGSKVVVGAEVVECSGVVGAVFVDDSVVVGAVVVDGSVVVGAVVVNGVVAVDVSSVVV